MAIRDSFAVDIWAFGCMMLEMCNKMAPYANEKALVAMVATATKGTMSIKCQLSQQFSPGWHSGAPGLQSPGNWSPELRDFVTQCLHMNPRVRFTATQLLNHPFTKERVRMTCFQRACTIIRHTLFRWRPEVTWQTSAIEHFSGILLLFQD